MKIRHKIINLSILAGIFYWIADAVCDFFFFYEGPFLDLLIFDVPAHEIYIRSVGIGLFFTFGIVLSKIMVMRQSSEQKSQEEHKKAKQYLDIAGVMIVVIDADQRVSLINKKGCQVLGYKEDEIIGKNWFDNFLPERTRTEIKGIFNTLMAGNIEPVEYVEVTILTKSGKERIIAWHNSILRDEQGKIISTLSSGKDITESKQTENKLSESEEQLRTILNSSPDMIMQVDTKMKILWANKTALDMDPKSIGQPCYKAYAGREEPCTGCPCKRAIETGQIEIGTKYQPAIKGIQGESYWEDIGVPLKDSQGKIISVIEIARNVTERKHSEKALRESEQKYSTLVEQAKDGISIVQGDIFRLVNKALAEITGYTVDELIEMPYEKVLAPELKGPLIQQHKLRITGEKVPIHYEAKIICKDGTIKDVEVSTNVIKYKNKPAVMTITRDITERKKMEEELRKMQKLESLGILAGGIAHDFNNLLTSVIGNLSLIELYAETGGNIFEVLEETKRASQQTKHLTNQLLTFAKGGEPIKTVASIAKLLKDTANLALSGSKVTCELTLPEDLWLAEVDEGQINQVINNLVINANQAMAGGGVIRIETENVIVRKEEGLPLKEGEYVKVSIKDQGTGIKKEFLQKIFDPYFTTKQAGSGLGLAISYSIIKKHEGHITVESEIGEGTTFTIFLPAFEKETFTVEGIEEEHLYRGKGKILFMDDKKNIRDMVEHMLNYLGYEVELVTDGAEAIEVYEKAKASGQRFEAVILDLTVPGGMGGIEAIRKLREINPEVKAIVSSGYANDPIMSEYEGYGFKGVITKPYEIKELGDVLHDALHKVRMIK